MTRPTLDTLVSDLMGHWRRLRRAHNDRTPSERRLIVLAVGAVMYLLVDTVWLSPAYKRFSQTRQALLAARAEQQAMQEAQQRQAADLALMQNSLQGDLKTLRTAVANEERSLVQAQSTLVPAREMRTVLQGLMEGAAGVRMLSVKTVARNDLLRSFTAGQDGLLYRHGLDVTVQGDFHDLLAWLVSVETMPRKLLWSGLKLDSDPLVGLTLTVRIFTLSKDPDPLEIAAP